MYKEETFWLCEAWISIYTVRNIDKALIILLSILFCFFTIKYLFGYLITSIYFEKAICRLVLLLLSLSVA